MIGALIMTHTDDRGLVVPPKLAPTEIVIVPIFKNESRARVLAFAEKVEQALSPHKVVLDRDEQNSPGWKFAQWELFGVPIRIEIGPRDVDAGQVVLVRRDTGEKETVTAAQTPARAAAVLQAMQQELHERARQFRESNTHHISDYGALRELFDGQEGFSHSPWCGADTCETKVKDDTKATIRVLSEAQPDAGACIVCGKPAAHTAVFSRAY